MVEIHEPRCSRQVAVIALQPIRWNMSRRHGPCVLQNIATRVTRGTLPRDAGVVHHGRHKRYEILVACITSIGGRDVIALFARRLDAIMTGSTSSGLHTQVRIGSR